MKYHFYTYTAFTSTFYFYMYLFRTPESVNIQTPEDYYNQGLKIKEEMHDNARDDSYNPYSYVNFASLLHTLLITNISFYF